MRKRELLRQQIHDFVTNPIASNLQLINVYLGFSLPSGSRNDKLGILHMSFRSSFARSLQSAVLRLFESDPPNKLGIANLCETVVG